ncbi:Thiocyanate hydrolase [Legionella sainthelensi]|uniref:Uncharacterized protein n=1 Tax=Legionella sainthelensi TaxID=28087 RepID=A0A2H5FMG7_9GAMM|nr:SH3-like domain-containing protein [Legionella sainthelensi]AUH72746.1 nitrile hydratase subunit beta [Legionella sainthelensi]VEB35646.1 Thiocyanate hydrolase [Legionella sainthelensi]
MSHTSENYTSLLEVIRKLVPVSRQEMDLPFSLTPEAAQAILHVVHDIGGQPDGPLDKSLHETELWEMFTHATSECLAWRGYWVSEERRRRENDLGVTLYCGTPYYARWLLAATKMLLDKGLITPDELMLKLDQIKKREEACK